MHYLHFLWFFTCAYCLWEFDCVLFMWFQTKVLTAIISLSHGDFLSCWCSSNLPEIEEDASLEYDTFAAVGWVLDNTSSQDLPNATILEFNLVPNRVSSVSYAHHRTSFFVKIIANLHCFVPNICEGWFFVNALQTFRITSIVLLLYMFPHIIYLFSFLNLILRTREEPFCSQGPGVLANGSI